MACACLTGRKANRPILGFTGKMGRTNDTTAVVDSHARVRGVSGLRVVDASAFPILPPGQPQSSVCKSSSPPDPRSVTSVPHIQS